MENSSEKFLELLEKLREQFSSDAGERATRAVVTVDRGRWLNTDEIVGAPVGRETAL